MPDDVRSLLAAHDLSALVEDGRVAAVGAGWQARLGRAPIGLPPAALVDDGSAPALAVALGGGTADVTVAGAAWRVIVLPQGGGALLLAVDVGDLRERSARAEAVLRDVGSTLARLRHRLGEAQALAKVGSFELDAAAHTLVWSPAMYELVGVPPDADLSDPSALARHVHPDDVDRVRGWFWSAPPEGERRELEVRFVRPDGTIRYARSSLTTDRGPDGRTIVCGSTVDVTELRAATDDLARARDEAERALREHARFLAALSHELRTPAAGVIGLVDLAIGAPAADGATRDLRAASSAARHLLAVIDDLLVYARLSAGLVELDRRDFDLADVVAEAVAVVAAPARGKGLAIDAWVVPETARWRRGDPRRVRELLVHVLVDAIARTTRGGVALVVAPGAGASEIAIQVDDTGPAVAPERLAAAFEPFAGEARGDARDGGTGLRLAIARALTVHLGGRIALATLDGTGRHVRIALDLPEGTPQPAAPVPPRRRPSGSSAPPAPLAARPRRARALHVLVADDTGLVRDVVARLLADDGHRATSVDDGDAAVVAAREPFDLILMDLSMPGIDGLAATQRIRAEARARGSARVPIVALTAWPDDEPRALAAGMDDYLVKPIDAGGLAALCDAVVAGAITPPIDRAALVDRVGGSAKLADDVAALFVARRDELADGVRAAVARGDALAIARAAHGTRGALAMVAAGPAVAAARELELHAGDAAAREALCARLVREIARAAAELAIRS